MLMICVCINQCSWRCATWGPSMLLLSSTDGLCWLLQACKQARKLQPAPPSKNRLHPQRYIYTCKPQPWFSFTFWSQFSVPTSQVGSFLNKRVLLTESPWGRWQASLCTKAQRGVTSSGLEIRWRKSSCHRERGIWLLRYRKVSEACCFEMLKLDKVHLLEISQETMWCMFSLQAP